MKDKPGEACAVAEQCTNDDGSAMKTPLEEWQWKAIEAGDYALLRKYDTGTTNVDQVGTFNVPNLIKRRNRLPSREEGAARGEKRVLLLRA